MSRSPYDYARDDARQLGVTTPAIGSERPDLLYPRATGDGNTLEIVSVQHGDITMRTFTKAEAVRFATRVLQIADGLNDD